MATQHCSLCLYQAHTLIPVRDEADILHTVHKYIDMLLNSNDCICVSCWTNVDNFRKFRLLIAERQENYKSQLGNGLEGEVARECAVEVQEKANLWTNENGKATKDRPILIELKDESLQTVENKNTFSKEFMFKAPNAIKLPELDIQDNILSNKQEPHSQLIKTEQTELTEQQMLAQTHIDSNTETEQSTATLPEAESALTELSEPKDGRQRLGGKNSRATEDKLIAQHMQLTCDVCKFKAKSFEALNAHFKKLHKCNGYVVCCQKRLYKRCLLLDHINVHRNPAYFSCTDCATNFADRLCLRNHMLLKHQQATELLHECAICCERFAKARFLQQHARKHTNGAVPDAEQQQQCTLCDKSFATAARLRVHEKNVHDKSKLFVCKHCGHEVSGKQCYVRHLAQHGVKLETSRAKRREQRVQCTVCDQWLSHKSTLRLHMQRHADAASVYACPLCDQKEATRVALNAHKRLCHGIEQQQHVCNVCARTFSTTRGLREHMTTHTGNPLYSCNYCDKRFRCSSNLHSHRKWKHPAEWAEDQRSKK